MGTLQDTLQESQTNKGNVQAVPVQKTRSWTERKLLLLKGVKLHGGWLEKLKSELTKLLGGLPYMGQASHVCLPFCQQSRKQK